MSFLTFWLVDFIDGMQRRKNSAVKPLLIILAFLLLVWLIKTLWAN